MTNTYSYLGYMLNVIYVVIAILVATFANRLFRSRPIGLSGDLAVAFVAVVTAAFVFHVRFNVLLVELNDHYPTYFALAYMPIVAFVAIGFVRSLVPLLRARVMPPVSVTVMAMASLPGSNMAGSGVGSGPGTAGAPEAKPPSKLMRRLQLSVGVLLLAVIAIVFLAKLMTSNDLPGCSAQSTKNILSNIFQSKKLDVKRYDDIRTTATTPELVNCTAAITLANDHHAELDYQISFVEDKQVQVKIVIARDK